MPIKLPDEDTAGGGQQPSARKPLSRSEAARHASLVRWGKEQPFAARLARIRAARKGRKPKGRGHVAKPKLTPEQRAAQKDTQRKANIAALGKLLDDADDPAMSARGLAALDAVRNGEEPQGGMADGLIKGGFAERGADGRIRLTPEGRALMHAADRGDAASAHDAISRASDRAAANDKREKAKAEKKGGGGGKGKKDKPDKDATKEQERQRHVAETARTVGLGADDAEALRTAADAGGARSAALARLGLIDASGDATDQGRRALAALEHGDARGYRAAVQDARARMARAAAQRTRASARDKAKATRAAQALARVRDRAARRDARPAPKPQQAALYAKAQTPEERAMFAAMGEAGTLRSKGADGKRTGPHVAGRDNVNPATAPTGHHSRSQPFSPEGLEAHARTGAQSFLGFEHANGMRVTMLTNTNSRGSLVKGTHQVTVHHPNGSSDSFQSNTRNIRTFGKQMKDRGMIYVSPHVSLAGGNIKDTDMLDYTDLLGALETARDTLLEDAEAAVKAGRRNSSGDQATIDQGYELAMQLCDLFEALGADTGEEDTEAAAGDATDDEQAEMKAIGDDPVSYAQHECGDVLSATSALGVLAQLAASEASEQDEDTQPNLAKLRQAMQLLMDFIGVEVGEIKAQQTFGGKPRGDLSDADFAGPDRTYPITTAQDVRDAAKLIGKADNPEAVKRKIIAIAKRKGFADAIPDAWKEDGATKGIELIGDDLAVLPGYGVKAAATGDGWVSGYLIKFGGDGDLSQWRDIFDKQTDYGRHTKTDVWVHHRMLPGLGKRRLTNQAEIGMDDEGVFIKHLLDLRSSYERKLYGMADDGKLGWSSGTAPHLVERKALSGGRHQITQWILGLDASYTPTPAGGFGVEARALAMKTLFADAGVDLLHAIYDDDPRAHDIDDRERPDAAKAADGRARRLALQARILTLQE